MWGKEAGAVRGAVRGAGAARWTQQATGATFFNFQMIRLLPSTQKAAICITDTSPIKKALAVPLKDGIFFLLCCTVRRRAATVKTKHPF